MRGWVYVVLPYPRYISQSETYFTALEIVFLVLWMTGNMTHTRKHTVEAPPATVAKPGD